jgi:hypothetical protein
MRAILSKMEAYAYFMVLDNKFKMMDIVTEYKACFLILKLVYG